MGTDWRPMGPSQALYRPAHPVDDPAVLSAWDDYPVHQTPALITEEVPAEPGWTERFYFNLIEPSGQIAAILGGGVYPQTGISESYFCHFEGTRQINRRWVQNLPKPGAAAPDLEFSLRIDVPLKDWSVTIDAEENGETFSGSFTGSIPPHLYPLLDIPASTPDGDRDLFRHFVAPGRWNLSAGGGLDKSIPYFGIRDRTWGVRSRRARMHSWCVFECDDVCLTVIHQEFANGTTFYSEAGLTRKDGSSALLTVREHEFQYDSSTREVLRGRFDLNGEDGRLTVEFEPVGAGIRLSGAGYVDGQGDGTLQLGEQSDVYDLGDPAVAKSTGRGTIDAGAKATVSGFMTGTGIGVIESAIARDHVTYGGQIA